jgi:YVTN family beta-propeller protein
MAGRWKCRIATSPEPVSKASPFIYYRIKLNGRCLMTRRNNGRSYIMHSDCGNGSCAASARGFMALFAVLAMGLGLMASPAAAAPFAYVTNADSSTVSVIDTATNTVVAAVVVNSPDGVAVTPDGNTSMSLLFSPTTCWRSMRPATRWWPRSRWGNCPRGSPLPRTGHTPMSQIRSPTAFQ